MKGIAKDQEHIFDYVQNIVFYMKQLNSIQLILPIVKGKNDQNIDLKLWQKAFEKHEISTRLITMPESSVDMIVLE